MTAQPFFIVGFQRSGTTLLRVMLNAHPDVAIPLDTTGLWARYEGRLARYGDLEDANNRRKLVTDLLAEERIQLWKTDLQADAILRRWSGADYSGLISAFHEEYAAQHGKSRWGDKDPGNMLRLDQINRWFPDSRIVHIIRDGRDACLSQLEQDFGFDSLLDCACAWREEVQWVRRMGGILGRRYYEIRYEDLVTRPEPALRELSAFLGLTYDPRMLEYHSNVQDAVPQEKRHIWPLINKPPQKDNVARWKSRMTVGAQVCFQKRAGTVLTELGYDPAPSSSGAYLEELRHLVRSALSAVGRRLRRP